MCLVVRSLASVAYRKALDSRRPYRLDYFSIDFDEELSAFHGGLLERQVAFTRLCIRRIMELYGPQQHSSVVLIGHSMVFKQLINHIVMLFKHSLVCSGRNDSQGCLSQPERSSWIGFRQSPHHHHACDTASGTCGGDGQRYGRILRSGPAALVFCLSPDGRNSERLHCVYRRRGSRYPSSFRIGFRPSTLRQCLG